MLEMYEPQLDSIDAVKTLGLFYNFSSFYVGAENLFNKALIMCNQLRGIKKDIGSVTGIAAALRGQEKFREAEIMYRQSLVPLRRMRGTSMVKAQPFLLNGLAFVLIKQDKVEEAESFYNESMLLTKEVYGERSLEFVRCLNGISSVFEAKGMYKKAAELYGLAIPLARELTGNISLILADSLKGLATALLAQSSCIEAEILFIESMEIKKRLLGKDHPSVLMESLE